MNIKSLLWVAMAIGFIFVEGCATPNTGNQPWDKPMHEDDTSTLNTPDYTHP